MNKAIVISLIVIIVFLGAGMLLLKSSKPAGVPSVDNVSNPNPPDRIAAGYVSGHVTIGPNCPGPERIGFPCPTPPEVYSSRAVVVYESDRNTIKENGNIDASGNYKIALGPGDYFVQISPAGIGPGEKKSATVKSFETTVVDFNIDTGMR